MLAVLDTSVVVAAMRSSGGASFALLEMVPVGSFTIALTVALYTEWQAVLTRPENMPPGVTAEGMLAFLRYLASKASLHDVHFLWRPVLRDPDDDMVLECAVASGAEHIVTHNVRDFGGVERFNVSILTPADMLAQVRRTP